MKDKRRPKSTAWDVYEKDENDALDLVVWLFWLLLLAGFVCLIGITH